MDPECMALAANRCIQWFGEFFPNSVDLTELERLIKGKKIVKALSHSRFLNLVFSSL